VSTREAHAPQGVARPPGLPQLDRSTIELAIEKLPALPPSATRLLRVLARGDWHLDEIVSVVSHDPVLAGRVLGLANSAAYAHATQIVSIRQAAGHLGIGTITSMAVAVAVHSTLRNPLRAYNASAGLLWRHSVAASLAVENLSATLRWTPPVESATTALLHDIGKLLLAGSLTPGGARLVARAAEERGCSTERAEAELVGSGHAEIGARIAEAWHLPERIARGIRHHHALASAVCEDDRDLFRAIAVADAVARRIAPGLGEVEERFSLERDAEATGFPADGIDALLGATAERLGEVLRLYES
jgi:putative nucleotidyltransferase with HDIG domain